MIKIEVDESYAYDALSILAIKVKKNYNLATSSNYIKLNDSMLKQIENHDTILKSNEYLDLSNTNQEIFDYLDKMKINPTIEDGVWVDTMNYQRFIRKKALQEKFFPDSKITEQKLGYDK